MPLLGMAGVGPSPGGAVCASLDVEAIRKEPFNQIKPDQKDSGCKQIHKKKRTIPPSRSEVIWRTGAKGASAAASSQRRRVCRCRSRSSMSVSNCLRLEFSSCSALLRAPAQERKGSPADPYETGRGHSDAFKVVVLFWLPKIISSI